MADDTELKVAAIIDASGVASGASQVSSQVDVMAARVRAAFGSIEKAPEGIQNALRVMASSSQQSSAIVQESIRAIEQSLERIPPVATAAGSSIDRAMSLASGRIAASIAGVGGLGTALSRVAAQLPTIGPLLTAAFPVLAAAAVVDIVYRLLSAIPDLADEFYGLDEAAKKAYQDIIDGNAKAIVENAQLEIAVRNLNQIGIDGSRRWGIAIQDTQQNLHTLGTTAAELQRTINQLTDKINTLKAGTPLQVGLNQITIPEKLYGFFTGTNEQIQQAQASLKAYQSQLDAVTKMEREMQQVTTARDTAEQGAEKRKEDQKELLQGLEEEMEMRKHVGELFASLYTTENKQVELFAKSEQEAWSRSFSETEQSQRRSAEKRIETEKRVADETLKGALESAKQAEALANSIAEHQARIGNISAQQALQERQVAAAREAFSEIEALNARQQSTPLNDVAELQKIEEQKLQVQRQYQLQSTNLTQQMTEQQVKEWDVLFASVNRPFESFIQSIMTGNERVSVEFRKMGVSILSSITQTLLQAGIKWAEHWILVNILQKSALAQQLADLATGNAAKHGITTASNVADSVSFAGVAAAAAFASVMEALPFPINVAAAPPAAATALSQGLGFAGIASQATGGMTGASAGLVMMHPREITMPSDVSAAFRNILANGGNAGDAVGGGGHSFVFAPTVHAVDSAGVDRMLTKHAAVFQKNVRNWVRNGSLR